MQSHWVNGAPYYRCRFPAEYALANHVEHPLNVNLREDLVIGHVDRWLAREFAPHRLSRTIRDLAAAQQAGMTRDASGNEEAARKIAECDAKLAQYRAALDAGASPATVATWIAETEAERASHALAMRGTATRPRMSEAEIKAIVDKLADIAGVLRDADSGRQGGDLPAAGPQADLPPRPTAGRSPDPGSAALVFRQCPRGDLNTHSGDTSPNRGSITSPS